LFTPRDGIGYAYENQIIASHPNGPGHSNNYFHEERQLELQLKTFHNCAGIYRIKKKQLQSGPTGDRERAVEKEVS